MFKIFYLLFFLLLSLDARDNPFFPSSAEMEIPLTSNEDRTKEPLTQASINIPSQSRIITKITVEFKNLDGSLESRSIDLDNSIDWHLPIFISQSYSKLKTLEQNSTKVKKDKFKKLSSIKYASFYSSGKTLKIITDDTVIRNFLLVNPHRIVVDFKKDVSLKYMSKSNDNNPFTKIRVGNHKGYYRVVIDLDGFYRYKMKKIKQGYLFKLR